MNVSCAVCNTDRIDCHNSDRQLKSKDTQEVRDMLASSAATSAANTPVETPRTSDPGLPRHPTKSNQSDSLSEDDRGLLQKALERIEFLEGQLSSKTEKTERPSSHESVKPSPKSLPKNVETKDPKSSQTTGEPSEDDTIVTPDGKAVSWSQKKRF